MAGESEMKTTIKAKLDFLKSCKEFDAADKLSAITYLRDTISTLAPGNENEGISGDVTDFMIKEGFSQLFVKMLKSCNAINCESKNETLSELHQMIYTIATKLTQPAALKEDLISSGMTQAFIEDLDSFDPNTNNLRQRIRILDNLARLQNFVHSPRAVTAYREEGAIPTLMRYVKSEDVNTKVSSLLVLACIVNEAESKHLGTSVIMGAMIGMVRKAVDAPNRKYQHIIKVDDGERMFKTTLATLIQGIIDLNTNDANKMAIVINGGIPVLSSILRPDYTDEQTCAAAEALWKLSFVNSLCDLISYHLTDTDTTALRVLKDMQASKTPKSRDVSKGLLFQMGLVDLH